jgi:hypothetical protein
MAYYNVCIICGCHLDPGEKCECEEISEQNRRKFDELITVGKDGQMIIGGLLNGRITG